MGPISALWVCAHLCLELFCGEAGLTASLKRHGLTVLPPWDIQLGSCFDLLVTANQRRLFRLLSTGHVLLVWLGTPCATWSLARRFDGGPPPLRDSVDVASAAPWISSEWDLMRLKEANLLADLTCKIIMMITALHGFFVVENPYYSKLWKYPPIINALTQTRAAIVHVTFCRYRTPWQKPTKLAGTLPGLKSLECFCRGRGGLCEYTGLAHIPLVGKTADGRWQTRVAEPYPTGLCDDIANLVLGCAHLERSRR